MRATTTGSSTARAFMTVSAITATLIALAISGMFASQASASGTFIRGETCNMQYTSSCGWFYNSGAAGPWACYVYSANNSAAPYQYHTTWIDTSSGRQYAAWSTAYSQQVARSNCAVTGYFGVSQQTNSSRTMNYGVGLWSGTPS